VAYQDAAIFFPTEQSVTADELLESAPNELQHSTPYLTTYANDQYSGQTLDHLREIKTS
jgi:hypothetical protein